MSATPGGQSGAEERKSKLPLKICHEVGLLPEGMRAALRQLMVEGALAEYAADAVNARHDWDIPPEPGSKGYTRKLHPVVTVEAVQHFYQSDPELQRDRAQFFVNAAEGITRALSPTGKIEEGTRRYVHSVLTAGLAKVGEKDKPLGVKEALHGMSEREHLSLKNRLMKLKVLEVERREAYLNEQAKLTAAKRKFVDMQREKGRKALEKLERKRNLTPETLQKIQEMYGIFNQSVAQVEPGPSMEQIEDRVGPPPSDADIEPARYYAIDEAALMAGHQQRMEALDKPSNPTREEAPKEAANGEKIRN